MSVAEESDQDRLKRNFNELLQDLGVVQAGIQILFGFLLSMVFTDRYQAVAQPAEVSRRSCGPERSRRVASNILRPCFRAVARRAGGPAAAVPRHREMALRSSDQWTWRMAVVSTGWSQTLRVRVAVGPSIGGELVEPRSFGADRVRPWVLPAGCRRG
jgi:hypothetical protein